MQDIVLCSDEGLAVRVGGGPVMSLPWSEVHCVHAHRLDAIHSQPVILGIEDESGHVVEVHESTEGWASLVENVARLAGCSPAQIGERIARLKADGPDEMLFSAKGG